MANNLMTHSERANKINSHIIAVDSIEEMQELLPGKYDYVVVRNEGIYRWDNCSTDPSSTGKIMKIEDTGHA